MYHKNFKFSGHFVFLLICFSIVKIYGQEPEKEDESSRKVFLSEPEKVVRIRQLIAQGNPSILKKYNKRIKEAEEFVHVAPFSVIQKTSIAPSGEKRDYLSIGPYWWPDPKKPDGLPWIRKDGEINPKTRDANTDIETKNKFFEAFETLAWAGIISEKDTFIRKAEELIAVWFANNATAMNPHLNYAQGIPGKYEGRGYGIIEFAGFSEILMYIELMDYFELLDKSLIADITTWTQAYASWLQNSELGKFEQSRKNNHGTWYDVQLVSILLYLNKVEEAKEILEKAKTLRIAHQIKTDGKQPHELKRTRGFSYSTMNLRAFSRLAYFGKKIHVDLWGYTAPNGASLAKAYEFLLPYAYNKKEWKYQQITNLEIAKDSFKELYQKMKQTFPYPSNQEQLKNDKESIDLDFSF